MRNGAYAGPVTDGKADDTVCSPPAASRSLASAGSEPSSSAAASVSGRAPSATRMMTRESAGAGRGGTAGWRGPECAGYSCLLHTTEHCRAPRAMPKPSKQKRPARTRRGQAERPTVKAPARAAEEQGARLDRTRPTAKQPRTATGKKSTPGLMAAAEQRALEGVKERAEEGHRKAG